jgi:hypothetical protein
MKTKLFIFSMLFLALLSGCVKDEVYEGAPSISELAIKPQAPITDQVVVVSAKVIAISGVGDVKLYYKAGSDSFTEVAMTLASGSSNIYNGQVPGQADGVTVNYYIKATNKSGLASVAPEGAPATTAAYTIGAPLIQMNELYSRGTVDAPDWVELYNASDVAVDISGYKIYDSGGQAGSKPKKEIPAGTTIAPKGFYVIVVDDGTETGFGLSSAGEQVWFENAAGNLIDNVTFPMFEPTQSYGRVPDGGNWEILNSPSPNAPNSTDIPLPNLYINEIYSQGTVESPDWVEIYNASPFDADLSGWKIYDGGGQAGSKPKKDLPAGTILPSKGFIVIIVDDETESGFGLSSNGEQIWLENPQGIVTKDVTFPALSNTQSFGCFPDGSDQLRIFETITPGAANSDAVPAAIRVVINEVYSRGTLEEPDWVEIYNDGNDPVDLSGWKIYDSGGQSGSKPKMEIPTGTTIAAKGFIVITVDDESLAGFGLSSNGEKVWFENTTAVVDSVEFPMMSETQSYGRFPDGSNNLQLLETITKGAPNSNAMPNVVVVMMNEVYSRGSLEEPDWVEIYNDGTEAVDLSGWKIYDSGGQAGSKPKMEFPAGTTIAAKGFFVITVDDESAAGFGLSSGGEKVWFENAAGVVVDSIEFPALETGTSYGRYPDGSTNLQIMATVTKGAANSNAIPGGIVVVMNEAYSRGTTTDPDWIEIYNDSNVDVDLTGYKIYDSGGLNGTKPKKEFPAGTIIPSKGFYVIVVDDADPSGFGLGSGGDEAWLEKPDGTVIDNVVIPALEVTQSYGRMPDGSENWQVLNTITRGTSNNIVKRRR